MELEANPKFQSDSAQIVDNEKGENRLRALLYKLRSREALITVPIVLSVIALCLSICACVGFGVRIHQLGPPGSSYVHWGRKKCTGSDANTVYEGRMVGSHGVRKSFGGGGVNFLCLPPTPEYNKVDKKGDEFAHTWLYATEYLTYDLGIFDDDIHGHDVVCSVCHVPRSAKIMIPAMRSCPSGWTKEYEGYLMSSYASENKATFECIDENPQYIEGTKNLTDASSLYFVSGYCGPFGGLNSYCPPYQDAKELTCVICTK